MTRQDPTHARYEALLMAAVDGVLTPDQRAELDDHLADCAQCRHELQDFTDIKEITDAMTDRIMKHASIEPLRPKGIARVARWLGPLAIIVGTLLLLGFGIYAVWTMPDVPATIRWGVALLAAGGVVAFLYVLRVRLRAQTRDPYLDVDQ